MRFGFASIRGALAWAAGIIAGAAAIFALMALLHAAHEEPALAGIVALGAALLASATWDAVGLVADAYRDRWALLRAGRNGLAREAVVRRIRHTWLGVVIVGGLGIAVWTIVLAPGTEFARWALRLGFLITIATLAIRKKIDRVDGRVLLGWVLGEDDARAARGGDR